MVAPFLRHPRLPDWFSCDWSDYDATKITTPHDDDPKIDSWDYPHDYVLSVRERKRPIELREHGDDVWFHRVLVSIEYGIPSLLHACATSRAVTLKLYEELSLIYLLLERRP